MFIQHFIKFFVLVFTETLSHFFNETDLDMLKTHLKASKSIKNHSLETLFKQRSNKDFYASIKEA